MAQLYRKRWRVETLFQVATENFLEDWQDLGTMSLPQFSSLLQDWANSVNLKAFTSAPRKPKQKKPKPPYDPRHPHVSTARLLAEKKKSRGSPPK